MTDTIADRNVAKLTAGRLRAIQPGQRVAYHTGLLMLDRQAEHLADKARAHRCDDIGAIALELYKNGRVDLVQQKQDHLNYTYFAIGKKHRPANRT